MDHAVHQERDQIWLLYPTMLRAHEPPGSDPIQPGLGMSGAARCWHPEAVGGAGFTGGLQLTR